MKYAAIGVFFVLVVFIAIAYYAGKDFCSKLDQDEGLQEVYWGNDVNNQCGNHNYILVGVKSSSFGFSF